MSQALNVFSGDAPSSSFISGLKCLLIFARVCKQKSHQATDVLL